MDIKQQIIELIRANKISSTEVTDALGKKGVLTGITPVNPRMHRVGELSFVYAFNHSNWEMHEQIQVIPSNKIVYVYGINCEGRAILGDLVSKYLLLYKKSLGIVVDGLIRDAHRIIKEGYPIWAKGVTPIGCYNRKNESLPDPQLLEELKDQYEGGILVCDDSGVALIPRDQINEDLYERLKFIELQEDIWFFCLDAHKMSTFEIVCEKKYLKEKGLIGNEQLQQLAAFSDIIDRK